MRPASATPSSRPPGHNVRNWKLSTLYILMVIDAFIRDESSKGRYDPGLTKICFEMLLELFNRTLRSDLGPRVGGEQEIEDVC
jgi:hypothetical protein